MSLLHPSTTIGCTSVPATLFATHNISRGPPNTFTIAAAENSGTFTCIPLLPFLLQDVYDVPGDMQDDQTHATAKGNKQVALNVEKLVTPLLKK